MISVVGSKSCIMQLVGFFLLFVPDTFQCSMQEELCSTLYIKIFGRWDIEKEMNGAGVIVLAAPFPLFLQFHSKDHRSAVAFFFSFFKSFLKRS